MRITLARFVHLATRRHGDVDHGCCVKIQNIPFQEADRFLPDEVANIVRRGRSKNARAAFGDADERFIPQIWAHQAGAVTNLHKDPTDAFLAQAAGTRIVTLYRPEAMMNPHGALPVEQLEAKDRAPDDDAPHLTRFPRWYEASRCNDPKMHNCTQVGFDGKFSEIKWTRDRHDDFSALDLGHVDPPDYTCQLKAGEGLIIPRGWWHRMDDDPRDAADDVLQVSFSWWYLDPDRYN